MTRLSLPKEGANTPAVTARGDIIEKPLAARKANWRLFDQALPAARRWRTASNRQTPVATETLRLLTLPPMGSFTR